MKVATKVMKDVDKYRQKEIAQYISCLATIGEQTDICTDVAYRLTLWYSDQIKCLASPSKYFILWKKRQIYHLKKRVFVSLVFGWLYFLMKWIVQ